MLLMTVAELQPMQVPLPVHSDYNTRDLCQK